VNGLLITGTALAGLVIGGVLDPIGQNLADLSRVQDERRRAERVRQAGDEERLRLGGQVPTALPPEGTALPVEPLGIGDPLRPAALSVPEVPVPAEPAAAPASEPEVVHHLLAAGRSPARTASAAVLTAMLFGGAAYHFGPHVIVAPFCAFFALLVTVSVTDLSHRLVPRRLIYGGLAVIVPLLVVTSAIDHSWHSLTGSAIAGAIAFSLFFAVWWFVPRGMGFGDVRLAGTIGLVVGFLSLLHAYIAFLAGFVAGLVFGLAVVATSASGRKTRIPFAPSLALGAVVSVFWGGHVAQAFFPVGS
jgi:prepilin signal peptidase PulO-like enzyme (type II secretory pathway)